MKFHAYSIQQLDDDTIMKIREWRNQDFVRFKMFDPHIISEKEHKDYIDLIKNDANRGLYVFYLDNLPFGVYQYKIVESGNYVINGNYLIKQEYGYMGYGVLMNYYMSEISFRKLKVNKVYGECIDNNKDAIRTNRRMGGAQEGILRQHILIDGQYHDVYCFGLLKEEWEKRRGDIKNIINDLSIEDEYERDILC